MTERFGSIYTVPSEWHTGISAASMWTADRKTSPYSMREVMAEDSILQLAEKTHIPVVERAETHVMRERSVKGGRK